eukprot:m.141206 g.141206  ORF g.141206 m.141206 type:complete len:100 (+) comp14035_c0_seq27:1638-1937(+)
MDTVAWYARMAFKVTAEFRLAQCGLIISLTAFHPLKHSAATVASSSSYFFSTVTRTFAGHLFVRCLVHSHGCNNPKWLTSSGCVHRWIGSQRMVSATKQ